MRLIGGSWGARRASQERDDGTGTQRHAAAAAATAGYTRSRWMRSTARGLPAAAIGAAAVAVVAIVPTVATVSTVPPQGSGSHVGGPGASGTGQPNAPERRSPSRRRLRAVLIAQRADCNGNLEFFSVLARRRIVAAVEGAEVLVEGASGDTSSIRRLLPRSFARASLRMLAPRDRALVQTLGYTATPLLLLYDLQGRLMLALPAHPTPPERVAFTRALTLIADAQET